MTYTFDGWDTPQNSLMHFRTKGSKNGVRRFQNEDGSWTPLGLRERKEREGWGETRKERRLQKKIDRAERHQARREARAEARAAAAERKRKSSLKGLTDEELKNKINRLKMEQEYKELNRSPLVKSGEKLVTTLLEHQAGKEQREIERNKQKIEMERIKADRLKATESTKRAKEERLKAAEERKKMEEDVKGGLKKERQATLLGKKMEYKNYTIRGGIARRINMKLTSGKAKQYEAERKAEGEANAARIRSDAARSLKIRKQKQTERDLRPEKKREAQLQKERERSRREYEKRMRRISSF